MLWQGAPGPAKPWVDTAPIIIEICVFLFGGAILIKEEQVLAISLTRTNVKVPNDIVARAEPVEVTASAITFYARKKNVYK